MEELNNLVRDKNKLLTFAGILHSEKAFVGPQVLHVDLTNHCNFNCIACWCRSPLLDDKAMPEWERDLTLPLELLKSVFDDLGQMGGLRQVKLVGGGEPFMHPDILEVIEYIKNKDRTIEIDINTNFSLVNEKTVRRLLELEVDSLTVSIWAGSPQAYTAVHPNQKESTFFRIKDMLQLISEEKKRLNISYPRVLIHDVIFKLNYRDIEQMLEFALDVGVDEIQFVPIDAVKEKTEVLLLDSGERKELVEKLYIMKRFYNSQSFQYASPDGKSIAIADLDGFIRRIENIDAGAGKYDQDLVAEIPCYVGWLFARIMATGNVVPCCKGHRMPMGNIHKNSFKDIWFSKDYNRFRYNGINLTKSDVYFSRIGNDAVAKTGCYNCDNLWQNMPMHNKISALKDKKSYLLSFCAPLVRNLFADDK